MNIVSSLQNQIRRQNTFCKRKFVNRCNSIYAVNKVFDVLFSVSFARILQYASMWVKIILSIIIFSQWFCHHYYWTHEGLSLTNNFISAFKSSLNLIEALASSIHSLMSIIRSIDIFWNDHTSTIKIFFPNGALIDFR